MKYAFKEGEWFDVRNMTGWQKQWCQNNLDIFPLAREAFEKMRHPLWVYTGPFNFIGNRFVVASDKANLKPEDEVTFEDFYWEEEEPELTRSGYKLKEGDYLDLSKLSDWQKDYLQNNFPCYNEETFDWGSYVYWESYEGRSSEFVGSWLTSVDEISFNTLFN